MSSKQQSSGGGAEFDTNLPSVRQVQNFIKEKKEVEIKLLTSDLLSGTIRWQDIECLCLFDPQEQPIIILRQAIAYIKVRN